VSIDTVGTALIRRHIGRRFEALRQAAGLSQEKAARQLDRSLSTIVRLEDGKEGVRFRERDVLEMLDLYGANEDDRKLLVALTAETRNGRKKSWWHDYTESDLPAWFGLYVTLEDSAETIRQYQSELIPGLLQTREYTEQLALTPPGYLTEDEVKRRAKIRAERQSLLTRPRAPHLAVILNEAIVRRPVKDDKVMADQLRRLITAGERNGVSVRMLPWSAGMHGGMGSSAFTLFNFPKDNQGNPLEPPLAYVESLTGAMYLNKLEEAKAYELVWRDLETKALDEKTSKEMIIEALEGFKNG
jgi:transcriptional regulator with XRE-family HTH domain